MQKEKVKDRQHCLFFPLSIIDMLYWYCWYSSTFHLVNC